MLTPTERACFDGFRRGVEGPRGTGADEVDGWVAFGLRLLLDAGRIVRAARGTLGPGDVSLKDDGSAVTTIEPAIEQMLRDRLADFAPDAGVVGEESGGTLPASGVGVAIDPVDGTWAFVTGTETSATTLAVLRSREPFLGMVSNAATGEIAYATREGGTRLLQLSLLGEEDTADVLPRTRLDEGGLLVNVHPSRGSGPLLAALHDAWRNGDLSMVRAPGGSPAWALAEAAKGAFAYVNLWSKRPAAAYDLVAGTLLVRRAGGDVTDLDGAPIDMLRHAGPFVASIDSRGVVASLVRAALSE
jgi:myo-inositol-1(or 4)-monophosphatase